ncbi:MAG: SAM-dependent methyltransferase [Sulfurihydrogenibium sp.]|jgi:adenine-specific DNA-methyltransferase|nr:SAM-dependent methyltransferase [Sulfurihydrogenibium sp.]
MREHNDIFSNLPEKEYLNNTEYNHRKKLGQFFTPMSIADFMTEWVIRNEGNSILDPALGLGVFFRSIIKNHPNRVKGFKFTGYEIDKKMAEAAKNILSNIDANIEILNKDHLTEDWDKKYDGIVCNPPYLKFHDYKSKDALLEMFRTKLGIELSGFTNIYTLFMLKSILQLKEGGRAAYIVPSEFLNSNYGKSIKKYIKKSGTLRFVIIIDFNTNVFEDAITTSSILLFANDRHNEEVEFINIKNFDELNLIQNYILSYPITRSKGKVIKIRELDEAQKWRIYYQELNGNKYKNLVPLSKYAKVSRGIATGSNEFFMFSESKRIKYGIRMEFLLPCLAKASYTKKHFFTNEDFIELKRADKPVYLLNATDLSDDNLREYISLGEKEGVHKRYLTSHRTPWYSIENRLPAPILATVFNRNGLKFIKNDAGVYNLTTFHCVYPNTNAITKIDLLMAYLITDVAKEIFDDYRREYGKGLRKFEPNDLNNALVIDIEKIDSHQEKEILSLFYEFKENETKGKDTDNIKNKLNEIFLEILKR